MAKSRNDEAIAIIGAGAVFPDAKTIGDFWKNIKTGKDSIKTVPAKYWDSASYFDDDKATPDKTYSKTGGFLSPLDFDPMKFGINPNAIEATDSSQLLGMVCAHQALVQAGYGPDANYDRERVSCIMGVTGWLKLAIPLGARLGHPIWRKALKDSGIEGEIADEVVERISNEYVGWQENSFPGLLGNVVAGRIANKFDFGGANRIVDAACASSLAAIHDAVMELRAGNTDMVVTGGADTFNDIFMFMCMSKTPALSPGGHAKPFDASADGTVLGEGVGVIILKRESDAIQDGDNILGLIRSTGASSDGSGAAIYEPTKKGQMRALNRAYQGSGIDPATVELVEAHGTGTKVGDRTEFTALKQVFKTANPTGRWCSIGSIKSQIGHAKGAAGIAGILKSLLALNQKVLPPTLKVEKPLAEMENSPFYINTESRPWLRNENHPRRAGVSGFGFGGANYHVVLEEYERRKTDLFWNDAPDIVALSGDSKDALSALLQEFADVLSADVSDDVWQDFLRKQRSAFSAKAPQRLTGVVRERDSAKAWVLKAQKILLSDNSWSQAGDELFYANNHKKQAKLAVVFPGQGAQVPQMMNAMTCQFQEYLDVLSDMDTQAREINPELGSVARRVFPFTEFDDDKRREQRERLKATDLAQPAIGAMSYATLRVMQNFGLTFDGVAGHSYGELVALCASGAVSYEDFLAMSLMRGRLMQQQCGASEFGMLAVAAPVDVVTPLTDGTAVELAHVNGPKQVVVGGKNTDLDALQAKLTDQNIVAKRLDVGCAFHTKFMGETEQQFREFIDAKTFQTPTVEVFSNFTTKAYGEDLTLMKDQLASQISSTVRFEDQIREMIAKGYETFVEVGPGSVMRGIIRGNLTTEETARISVFATDKTGTRDIGQFAMALCGLSARGIELNLAKWKKASYIDTKEPIAKGKRFTLPVAGYNYRNPKNIKDIPPRKIPLNISDDAQHPLAASMENSASISADDTVNMPAASSQGLTIAGDSQQTSARSNATQQAAVMTREGRPDSVFNGGELPPLTSSFVARTPVTTAKPLIKNSIMSKNNSNKLIGDLLVHDNDTHTGAPLGDLLTTTQRNLEMLQRMQARDAQLHQEYLAGQRAKQEQYFELYRMQIEAMANLSNTGVSLGQAAAQVPAAIVQTPAATVAQMPLVETPTIRTEPVRQTVTPVVNAQPTTPQVANAPITSTQSTTNASPSLSVAPVVKTVIAEKTGYPEDMIDETMHMESDLGIDSIKKVEILASLQEKFSLSGEADQFASASSVGEIIGIITAALASVGNASTPVAASTNTVMVEQILAILSEKTGYPAEMIEAQMDMEADLGIDSIKRVEILSAIQALEPSLQNIDTKDLGHIKLVEDLYSLSAVRTSDAPIAPARVEGATVHSPQNTEVQVDNLSAAADVLAVIAEKTGYPEDMLDSELSLEADLGIDSIKKVEIFSALQSQLTIEVSQQDAATIQTVGEVIAAFSATAAPAVTDPATNAATKAAPMANELAPLLKNVVAEKTGYPVEMIEDDMSFESDLGIDSIKKVEIFSALQNESEALAGIDSEKINSFGSIADVLRFLNASQENSSSVRENTPITAASEAKTPTVANEVSEQVSEECMYLTPMLIEMNQERSRVIETEGRVWLLHKGDDLAPALAGQFEKRGYNVEVHSLDSISKMNSIPTDLRGVVISAVASEEVINISFLRDALVAAKTLGSVLTRNEGKMSFTTFFAVVSGNGGHLGFAATDDAFSPVAGGLAGLAKSAGHEWEGTNCKYIDIVAHDALAATTIETVCNEILTRGPSEVAINNKGIYRVGLCDRSQLSETTDYETIGRDDVIVISGGARGVSAQISMQLAEKYGCGFVILGRSKPRKAEPAYLMGLESERDIKGAMARNIKSPTPKKIDAEYKRVMAEREIRSHIQALKTRGSKVFYASCDVTNRDEVREAISAGRDKLGTITGLIHGAGILDDKLIIDKQIEGFDRVLDTKVRGFENLLAAAKLKDLKLISVLSSSTARFGRKGQVDYAMANEVLNKRLQQIKTAYPEKRVAAPNFGPWDGGMVGAGLKELFKRERIGIIPMAAGSKQFVDFLDQASMNPEVVVFGPETEPEAFGAVMIAAHDPSAIKIDPMTHKYLRSHMIGGKLVMPAAMMLEFMTENAGGKAGELAVEDFYVVHGLRLEDRDQASKTVNMQSSRDSEADGAEVVHVSMQSSDDERVASTADICIKPLSIPSRLTTNVETATPVTKDDIYESFLFHGKHFQGIAKLTGLDDKGIAANVDTAPARGKWILDNDDFENWVIDPLVIDSAFQMITLWSEKNLAMACLPSRVGELKLYREIPTSSNVRININMRDHSSARIACDIDVIDHDEMLLATLKNVEATVSDAIFPAFDCGAEIQLDKFETREV